MSSLRTQSHRSWRSAATVNGNLFSTVETAPSDGQTENFPLPGSLNDGQLVRGVLIEAIRKCGKSRAQIADEISRSTGRDLTEISLNKFTAESRTDYRWPAELDRAFCAATGDDTLLRCRVEMAGYKVIGSEEMQLLELGRQYLMRQRASAQVSALEQSLAGVDL